MKREAIITDDGSSSLYLPKWNESYHSTHGALQEAYYVFIAMGLSYFAENHPEIQPIKIMEMGFGTGLNSFISLLEAEKNNLKIYYTGLEASPVQPEEIKKLNYVSQLSAEKMESVFLKMHELPWKKNHGLTTNFQFKKELKFFKELSEKSAFHLVYFDAFGPRAQPELWTEEIFSLVYEAMKKDGVLVTYSAKGSARRAMQAVGFSVERLPGPPGKRHMLRATKK